jgi:hypothetical protein
MTATRSKLTGLILVAGCLGLSLGGVAQADPPPGKGLGKPVAGDRSLGDPLLPQLGNGGYDVGHYRIDLDYDPAANRFVSARTMITAAASEKLEEFSLDFQDDLEVTGVTVDGRAAGFDFEPATPQLSTDPDVTQPMKLVVTPHPSTWPKGGRDFKVQVSYR